MQSCRRAPLPGCTCSLWVGSQAGQDRSRAGSATRVAWPGVASCGQHNHAVCAGSRGEDSRQAGGRQGAAAGGSQAQGVRHLHICSCPHQASSCGAVRCKGLLRSGTHSGWTAPRTAAQARSDVGTCRYVEFHGVISLTEPYRLILSDVRDRLWHTKEVLQACMIHTSCAPPTHGLPGHPACQAAHGSLTGVLQVPGQGDAGGGRAGLQRQAGPAGPSAADVQVPGGDQRQPHRQRAPAGLDPPGGAPAESGHAGLRPSPERSLRASRRVPGARRALQPVPVRPADRHAAAQAQCFGLAMVRLDIRQESTRHTDAITAITSYLGFGNYSCAGSLPGHPARCQQLPTSDRLCLLAAPAC